MNTLPIETTRKKSLEIMQKGMIGYKLANLGWDVAEHFGDGYDLLCTKQVGEQNVIARIELKAIDLNAIQDKSSSFTQAVSVNEIISSSHVIISIMREIEPLGHYILSTRQLFDEKKKKETSKFRSYKSFDEFLVVAKSVALDKISRKKGAGTELPRLNIDISSNIKKFLDGSWDFEVYKDKWDNILTFRD